MPGRPQLYNESAIRLGMASLSLLPEQGRIMRRNLVYNVTERFLLSQDREERMAAHRYLSLVGLWEDIFRMNEWLLSLETAPLVLD